MLTSPVCKLDLETKRAVKKIFDKLNEMQADIRAHEVHCYATNPPNSTPEEIEAEERRANKACEDSRAMKDEYSNLLMDTVLTVLDACNIPLELRIGKTFDLSPDCNILVVVH